MFDRAVVKNIQRNSEVETLPRSETFPKATYRKNATIEDLEFFLGYIPVFCDQDECLREVSYITPGRFGHAHWSDGRGTDPTASARPA